MRADMGKVLVERPRLKRRSGDSSVRKGYRKKLQRSMADDETSTRERLVERYSDRKFFNENLAPLRRFLQANVGRPWNKVYAEICQHVDRGNVVQKHILTHLFDYVVTHTILIDGEPCRGGDGWRRYGESLRTTTFKRHQWYVCPKSGILRQSRYVPYVRKRPDPPRRVVLNKSKMCLFLNGQWELVTVAPLPGAPDKPSGYDVIHKRGVSGWPRQDEAAVKFYGAAVYAVARRPLSRTELRAMPIPIEWLP